MQMFSRESRAAPLLKLATTPHMRHRGPDQAQGAEIHGLHDRVGLLLGSRLHWCVEDIARVVDEHVDLLAGGVLEFVD